MAVSVPRNAINAWPSVPAIAAPNAAPIAAEQHALGEKLPHHPPARRADRQRTAISRCRALARASIRLARFAHAISSTTPAMARRIHSESAYCSRSSDTPCPAGVAIECEGPYCAMLSGG